MTESEAASTDKTRMWLKNRGISLIAIFKLALGIGATTAIFTLLDKVLIRALPVAMCKDLNITVNVSQVGGESAFSAELLYGVPLCEQTQRDWWAPYLR